MAGPAITIELQHEKKHLLMWAQQRLNSVAYLCSLICFWTHERTFILRYPSCAVKILIRLHKCACWSGASLDEYVWRYVFWCLHCSMCNFCQILLLLLWSLIRLWLICCRMDILTIFIYSKYWDWQAWVNGVDPDKMYLISLHCLPYT